MKKQIKKGFSLLELILVLGVGTTMGFIKLQDMKHDQEDVMARAVGSQIKQVGEAVNRYISIRYDKLSTLTSSSSQTSDPGPRNCSAQGCEITYQTLVNEGLLPSTYSGINAQKSSYKLLLKRSGVSPNYVINGLVITTTPWIEGGNTRYDLLGKAMQAAGIDSGMTQSKTQVSGYNGSWSEKSSDYSSINNIGLLSYRVGFDSSMYSVYLRRDGTLPMTGNLDLGGKDITNTKNISASGSGKFGGDIVSGGSVTAAGQIIAHNGYGHELTIGGDAAGNDFDIRIGPGGKNYLGVLSMDQAPITLAANGVILARSPITSTSNVKLDGVAGTVNATGDITSGGWLWAKNGYGDVIGFGGDDITNDYEIRMMEAKGLALYAPYLDKDANLLRTSDTVLDKNGNKISGGKTSFILTKAGNITTIGNIAASGNITSNGRLVAGEFIQINGIATAGGTCSPNGLQGRSATGTLLSCVGGKWQSQSNTTLSGMYAYRAVSCIAKNAATGGCSCSAGTKSVAVGQIVSENCTGHSNNCTDNTTTLYACVPS